MRCKKCGLIFSNPMPIPEKISDHYGITPESYWKPEYFMVSDDYMGGLISWLQKLKPQKSEQKVLDIGAGIGKAMIAFERKGYDTYGIEPSESFYKRSIDKMNISPSKITNSSIEDVEFEKNEFDIILFSAVLEHLYDPSKSIIKAMKWLKPGGLIFIEVPSSNWLISKIFNFSYKFRGLDYVTNHSPMHEPYHLYEFSLKSFYENAKSLDYEVVDYKYYVCDTFLPGIFDPILKPIMKWTNTGMELAVWLRKK